MRATHLCGFRVEGPSAEVREAIEHHKERCAAEHEAQIRANRTARHPGRRFVMPRLR